MHFKYSAILNIVFVTFMFGLGLPMLFPYALLAIIVLWVSEKALFFYSYRLPPMYDASLGTNVINKMKVAPIFMMVFGYWFFSSNQLLNNRQISPVMRKSDTPLTDHTYASLFKEDGWNAPAWPLLVMSFIMIVQYFFGGYLGGLVVRCFPSFKIGDIELNEEIDTYWNSLDDNDRKWTIAEEEHFRSFNKMSFQTWGVEKGSVDFSMMSDQSLADCKASKSGPKSLQGTHSYDILANPRYYNAFNYVAVAQDEGDKREEFIIDDDSDEDNDFWQSDKVRIGLNMAYFPESMGKGFSFTYVGKDKKDNEANPLI